MSEKTSGQIAYEAYCAQSGWKSLASGQQLPPWDEVKSEIKIAWEYAGGEVWRRNNSCNELRDKFAAAAMQAYMMGNSLHDEPYQWGGNIANLAYVMADYMMARRAHLEAGFETLKAEITKLQIIAINDAMLTAQRRLCYAIEEFPASEHQTKVISMASEIAHKMQEVLRAVGAPPFQKSS